MRAVHSCKIWFTSVVPLITAALPRHSYENMMFYGEKACHINPIKLPGVLHFMKGGEVCEGGGRGGGAGGGGGRGGEG